MPSLRGATWSAARRALPATGTGLLWAAIGVLVLALALLVTVAAPVPPLQDLNEWTYQGYLIGSRAAGDAIPAAVKHWPVPNAVTQLALAGLTIGLAPITAAKGFVGLYLLLGGAVLWQLSRRRDGARDGLRFALLVTLVLVHAPYWSGEFNYQVGLLVLTCYFGLYGAGRAPPPATDIAYSVLLFFCHALCLGVWFIHVGWRSLLQRRLARGVASMLPALALLVWYAVADPRPDHDPALRVGPKLTGFAEQAGYRLYVLAKIGPYQNMVFGGAGDADRFAAFYWLGTAVNFAFAGAMALLFLAWLRARRTAAPTPELLTAVSCAVIAAVDPGETLGIGNAGERFIYPALIIAVLCFEGGRRWRQTGAVLGGFAALLGLHLLIGLPPQTTAISGVPDWSAMNDPRSRFRILFWHRPFLYLGQIEAGQDAATTGAPPAAGIMYETSLLQHRR
ncbi:MAG: hypothetical protein JOZ42_14740 [Acetobacteraceae bacterium]|nr:hypothetical protein [Acetobacteraceae bacterium]